MKAGAETLNTLSAKHLIILGTLYFRQDRPFSTKTLCHQVLKLKGKGAMEKTRTILNRLEKMGLIATSTERAQGVQVRDWHITDKGKLFLSSQEVA